MAFDFPTSPSAGQEFTPPGTGMPTYVWESPRWIPKAGTGGGGASLTISDTAPASPTVGSLWYESDTGNTFIWYNDGDSTQWVQQNIGAIVPAGTAQTRNRVVNPCFQISQENGNTASATKPYYAADQWNMSGSGTSYAQSTQRVASATPNGSVYRHRITVTTAKAALVSGDFLWVGTTLEGNRMADFRYGSASARQSVLRFGFKAPAGTYSVQLMNSAGDRTYFATITISAGQANTDTVQTLVIPGDVTGTWLTDTGVGMWVSIILAAHSAEFGVAGWQAGAPNAAPGQTNGLAALNTFELFDVGLYLDPDATGVPPKWTMPDEAQELAACQRYWQSQGFHSINSGYTGAGAFSYGEWIIPPMRISPAVGFASISYNNASALTADVATPSSIRGRVTTTAAAASGAGFNMTANARM